MLINNAKVAAKSGATFDRRNPITNEVVTTADAAGVEDAEAAVSAAADAFPAWSSTGPGERRRLLLKAAQVMESRTEEAVSLMMRETGCVPGWVHFNTHVAADMLREAAAMTTQIQGEVIPSDKPGCLAMSIRQPVGVVLGIAPWNAPIILGVRAIAMPLACGNTVILKASEISPGTHLFVGSVMQEAGFPPGVVNVVTNAPADAATIVDTLVAHHAVKRVNFTGSTKVGKIIAAHAARYLKPVLLELGGKAPMIVLDDADIDAAVNAAAFGAFMHQGQICMSTERLIIDEKVADEFVAKLSAKARTLPVGDPSREEVVLGALINASSADHVHALIQDAKHKGAHVVAGGERNGVFVNATVIDNVTSGMRIYAEESFGPVASVVRVRDVDEAIKVANDTEYGLSAAVFGRDLRRALEVAKRIESGMCHINGPTVSDEAQMPFGGVKASGYGRFGGKAAIDEFTDLRWITIEDPGQHYPF